MELHAEHGTTLIETFSHEQAAGRLTENLAEKLRAHGVNFARIPREEIYAVFNERGRVEPLTQLVATLLQYFKGARLSFGELERRVAAKRDGGRSRAFLRVFRPIFERYEATLAQAGEIDFHDMINCATDHVSAGRYRSPYGYVLVDEFQDISPGRAAALLKALVDQSPTAQLFAVGDDWQAIFRFAGSERGARLNYHVLARTFVQLARRLGLRGPVGTRGVSLHHLRSFAVSRLAAWAQQGVVVRDRLPALAVYLGHISPQNTYWYLTATPPVLEPAAARFEAFVDGKVAP